MARGDEKSASSAPKNETGDLFTAGHKAEPNSASASGGSGISDNRTVATRPRQVVGNYPVRQVTFYQIGTSDIRSIGIAQAATTICAAIGTFALSVFIDFNKDLTLAIQSGQQSPPEFLERITSISFWAWLLFWAIAILSYIYQRSELVRIKEEHGEPSIWNRLGRFWANRRRGNVAR